MLDDAENILIDKIYEASFITERWPNVLCELSAIADCDKALLFAQKNHGIGSHILSEGFKLAMDAYEKNEWGKQDIMTHRAIVNRQARFMTTQEILPEHEIENSPYYREFMIPYGLRWSVGTVITSPSENMMVIGIHRGVEKGPIDQTVADRLTKLRPHLARSALAAARLRLEQARAALQALNAMGIPACAITSKGKLRIANTLFEAIIPTIVEDRADRLHFRVKDIDSLFLAELDRWKDQLSGREGKTFPIKARNGAPAHIVHLLPISGDNRDIFSATQWIIVIVPVEISSGLNFTLLEGLFDLTASEAYIAGGLAGGKTLQEIADERGASIETVRTQLKSIMLKTGTNRQAELVALLSNAR